MELEGISEQGTVISNFTEFIFLLIGDATLVARPLLLLVDSVVIPHYQQSQKNPSGPSETRNQGAPRRDAR